MGPGDMFGAKKHPDRMLLGRIFFEGRPSAHFLCISADPGRRLYKLPYFMVTNSLEPDEKLATFALWTCIKVLPVDYQTIYKRDFTTERVSGNYEKDREQELLDSCDRVIDASVSQLKDLQAGLEALTQGQPVSKTPTRAPSIRPAASSSSLANPPPAPQAAASSTNAIHSAQTSAQVIPQPGSQQFIDRHIKPEYRKLINQMPRRTAIEKEFATHVLDALVYFSISKK